VFLILFLEVEKSSKRRRANRGGYTPTQVSTNSEPPKGGSGVPPKPTPNPSPERMGLE